ncbi:hypothetical protein [Streptomyces sp. SM12]|uniref:hypothetical protein n=1 Tax=Streptomyces sp. SM12 TaxID=1071602 RepID=UPI000CD5BE0E|nr:hypothetical protein [Streptomyces sp. SM12]
MKTQDACAYREALTHTMATTHPASGFRQSYEVTVQSVERDVTVTGFPGLGARVVIRCGNGRSMRVMASRLAGEGAWHVDAKTQGGRVIRSRGFGDRAADRRPLLADVDDVLSLAAMAADLVESCEPGQPLVLCAP